MKKFRKSKKELFICEECEKIFFYKKTLSRHINKYHSIKEYYDKWLKENDEGLCKICKKETKFTGFKRYYKKTCSKKCEDKYRQLRIEEENLIHFGVKNHYQREDVKEKIKQTCIKKYGVECSLQNKEVIKKGEITCLKLYNNKDYRNYEKSKKTKKERYGDENYNNPQKNKETCLQRYGVENPNQNMDILKKGQKTRFEIKKFKNTELYYQGSYELDFLEKYYDKHPDIERGPTIKYLFECKNKIYFSDFYISELNLIIEIKNSYLYKKSKKKIKAKEKATIANGFNYIIVIDKNYIKLEELIHLLNPRNGDCI